MEEITLSKRIANRLQYYTEDRSRRCKIKDNCRYSGQTLGIDTEGCFVGAELPEETRLQLDLNFKNGACIKLVISGMKKDVSKFVELPSFITDNVELWNDFQKLHDSNENWPYIGKGLSDVGQSKLKELLVKHQNVLVPEDFTQFLSDEK